MAKSNANAAQSSTELSDSYNTNVTASLAAGAVGLTTGNISDASLGDLTYESGSNNTTNNAGADSSSSGGTGTSTSPFDITPYIPYLLIGASLFFVFKLLHK